MSDPSHFVAAVESRMEAALSEDAGLDRRSRILAEASRHLCVGGGAKRFRPRLVQLLGEAFAVPEAQSLRIAVAAELIHAASLLHDDVIDAGTERRGRPTANVQWGNSVAVLGGDWLLTRAILEIVPLGASVLGDAIETIAAMTRAAVREVEARGRPDLRFEAWRSLAEGKAGELFSWCGRSIATLASDPASAAALAQVGRRLGVAFQMADDLKDVLDPRSGKDRFADLKNRNPSFVLVLATEDDPALRDRLAAFWSQPPGEEAGLAALAADASKPGVLQRAADMLGEEIRQCLGLLSAGPRPTIAVALERLAGSFASEPLEHLGGVA